MFYFLILKLYIYNKKVILHNILLSNENEERDNVAKRLGKNYRASQILCPYLILLQIISACSFHS
jgi:hypothetical protein